MKIYRRKCNCCGKYYEGCGKKYCSQSCATKINHKTSISTRKKLSKISNRGGSIDTYGYRVIMKLGRRVKEHRWVMEQHLDRKLRRNEEVHHKNRIRADNRVENLEVVVVGFHKSKVRCPHCLEEFSIK